MGGPFHECLGPAIREARVKPLDHGGSPAAGEEGAEVFQTEPAVHFGVPAAGDVELQGVGVVAEDGQFQGATGPPALDGLSQVRHVVATDRLSRGAAGTPGEVTDDPGEDFPGPGLPDLGGEGAEQGGDYTRFDFALLEQCNGKVIRQGRPCGAG